MKFTSCNCVGEAAGEMPSALDLSLTLFPLADLLPLACESLDLPTLNLEERGRVTLVIATLLPLEECGRGEVIVSESLGRAVFPPSVPRGLRSTRRLASFLIADISLLILQMLPPRVGRENFLLNVNVGNITIIGRP